MSTEQLYGNLQGLKSNQLKQLQRLYQQKIPNDCFTTIDFAQKIAALSTEIKQPLSIYINRRGQVIRVGVGTPRQTQIPPLELPRYGAERLCGIRCLATKLKDEPPKESSLTAMARQRLDALVTITLTGSGFQRRGGGFTGFIKDIYVAHLIPQTNLHLQNSDYWEVSGPFNLEELFSQDFLDLVANLEAEFSREFSTKVVDPNQDRVLLVGLMTKNIPETDFDNGLLELARLVDTAGGIVLDKITQKRVTPHPRTVLGEGKVDELALAVQRLGANLVAFDRDLSPAQVRNLELQLGVRVVDRTEVILDIFAQRAQSKAGKLQVELAQLEYMLPRLTGRGQAMSRLGGGIGTRGPGETKLETERRAIASRISRLQQEVNQLQAHRSRLRQQREHRQVPSLAIVGYTNAGKSTLINALTNATVYVADQLFATLDPTTRRLTIKETGKAETILITDTVGFINELPPSLVDAFRATLEEVTEADALLHLVDLSHPAWQKQINSVTQILAQMPISPGPMLLVFNKIDQANNENLTKAREEYPLAVFISASNRLGFETLRTKIAELVAYSNG